MSGHGHGAGHGHGDDNKHSKTIAIVISVLALCLAIAETMAKGAQTASISQNVEASNLWSFYQGKTIRQTMIKTAAEQMEIDVALSKDPAVKSRLEKRVADWKATVDRYESEPNLGANGQNNGEGKKELAERAKEAGKKRDYALAQYHQFEISSAAFQIAIVLASAYLITSALYLLWATGIVGAVGVLFGLIGLFAPNAIHLIH
jgi:Domain of unknown function (DUF4337)